MKSLKLKTLLESNLDISDKKLNFTYKKHSNTFFADISNLKNQLRYQKSMKDPISLWNSNTGNGYEFKYWKTDYSGPKDEQEIAGWWYKTKDGKFKLLIIND